MDIVLARFDGECPRCEGRIWAGNDMELGDEIVCVENDWIHSYCVEESDELDDLEEAEAA